MMSLHEEVVGHLRWPFPSLVSQVASLCLGHGITLVARGEVEQWS